MVVQLVGDEIADRYLMREKCQEAIRVTCGLIHALGEIASADCGTRKDKVPEWNKTCAQIAALWSDLLEDGPEPQGHGLSLE